MAGKEEKSGRVLERMFCYIFSVCDDILIERDSDRGEGRYVEAVYGDRDLYPS